MEGQPWKDTNVPQLGRSRLSISGQAAKPIRRPGCACQKRLGAVQLQADSKGRLSDLITVPANLPIGENIIVVERRDSNVEPPEVAAKFYVLAQRAEHQGG